MTPLLYSYRRCPFAIRVRMVLHEKNIPFEIREEDLKNMSDELKRMHPEGKVPLLVHGREIVYESAIITEYIDDAFPVSPRLMPTAAPLRAQVRLWTYWCNTVFKQTVDRFKYGTSRFSESECVGSEDKLLSQLNRMESRLKKCSWLVGEDLSLADIHVFPFYRQLRQMKPAPDFLSNYTATNIWLGQIEGRESFRLTMER